MKCELCNGKGVINDADTLYGVRYCPQCDAGNLQLRLDHNFQPVIEEDVQLRLQIEAAGREPNPIYADIPFVRVDDGVLEYRPNVIEGKPVTNDEAREWARQHPEAMAAKMPPAVQEFVEKQHGVPTTRDEAVAEVQKLLARAGLRIVPLEDIKQAVRAIEDLRDDIKHEYGVNSATRCDKTIQALCALLPKE